VTIDIWAVAEIWDPQLGELIFRYEFGTKYPHSVTLSSGGLLAMAAHRYNGRGEIRVVRIADDTVVKSLQLHMPLRVRFASPRRDQAQEDLYFYEDEPISRREPPPLLKVRASSLSTVQKTSVY